MTGDDTILHADMKRIGMWLRWVVPLVLVGLGAVLKYTRDIDNSLHALIVSDTQMKEMLMANRESLLDKYSRHLGIHEHLENRLLYPDSCPKDSK